RVALMSRELPVTDCGRKKVFASRAPCGMMQPHRVQQVSSSTSFREDVRSGHPWDSPEPARTETLADRHHMIAVGGAGSSGLPALASGTRIITATSTAKAIKGATAESPMARCRNVVFA